jgi:hypothetical protein
MTHFYKHSKSRRVWIGLLILAMLTVAFVPLGSMAAGSGESGKLLVLEYKVDNQTIATKDAEIPVNQTVANLSKDSLPGEQEIAEAIGEDNVFIGWVLRAPDSEAITDKAAGGAASVDVNAADADAASADADAASADADAASTGANAASTGADTNAAGADADAASANADADTDAASTGANAANAASASTAADAASPDTASASTAADAASAGTAADAPSPSAPATDKAAYEVIYTSENISELKLSADAVFDAKYEPKQSDNLENSSGGGRSLR